MPEVPDARYRRPERGLGRLHQPVSAIAVGLAQSPYSDIGPWVEKAIEQQGRGIGTVMLVPQDTSTEWYPGERASEVRHITGYHDDNGKWRNGRVNFINKETGEEMKGNPKGSMFLIFAPGWRGECRIRDVSKLTLLLAGAESISAAA